ncbi:MAG TPA: hypothetical protein VG097_03235, partial [Gemmata sp.]|nr:hypothetical protein [Gemmata sp.]
MRLTVLFAVLAMVGCGKKPLPQTVIDTGTETKPETTSTVTATVQESKSLWENRKEKPEEKEAEAALPTPKKQMPEPLKFPSDIASLPKPEMSLFNDNQIAAELKFKDKWIKDTVRVEVISRSRGGMAYV